MINLKNTASGGGSTELGECIWMGSTGGGLMTINDEVYLKSGNLLANADAAAYTEAYSKFAFTYFDATGFSAQTTPIAANNYLNEIAYGNSTFVAVGINNTLVTSPDGITWTSRTTPFAASDRILDIAFGNGLFVIISGFRIATSPDGITWTSRTNPQTTNGSAGVSYGNGIFIIIQAQFNSGSSHLISSDGITWVNSATFTQAANGVYGLAFGNGLFVAGSDTTAYYTTNGVTWTKTTIANNIGVLSNVVYTSNGLFFALGAGGAMYSNDGINFTKITLPAVGGSAAPLDIFYKNGSYNLVYNTSTSLLQSKDLITWYLTGAISTVINLSRGIVVGNIVVIIGNSAPSKIIMTTTGDNTYLGISPLQLDGDSALYMRIK